jgi:alkylation response protein AidB-like acyl-CoA dehydrogenase
MGASMTFDKSQSIKAGVMMIGAEHPVQQMALLQRDRIQKGAYLHGGECPVMLKSAVAKPLSDFAAIAQRLADAAKRLEDIRRAVRRK